MGQYKYDDGCVVNLWFTTVRDGELLGSYFVDMVWYGLCKT